MARTSKPCRVEIKSHRLGLEIIAGTLTNRSAREVEPGVLEVHLTVVVREREQVETTSASSDLLNHEIAVRAERALNASLERLEERVKRW